MMHDHDLDLIAAFADGDDPDGIAVRLVEQCPRCAAEYRNQQVVSAALGSMARIRLDDREREELHDGVSAALGPTITRLDRRWIGLAAAAAAVLMVGSLGGLLGGDDTTREATGSPTIAAALGEAESSSADSADSAARVSSFNQTDGITSADGTLTDLGEVTKTEFVAALEAEGLDQSSMKSTGDTVTTPPSCSESVSGTIERVFVAQVEGEAVIGYVVNTEVGVQRIAFRLTDCTSYALG